MPLKNIAIGLLMVVLLSILVEPLIEIANIMREKIIIGSALTNSCRAAEERCIDFGKQRDMDVEIDADLFKDYFSEAFESAMNVIRTPASGTTMTFTSDDGKYNTFTVTLNISNTVDAFNGKRITEVDVKLKTRYKFKTKYLKLAEGASGTSYDMLSERMLLLRVRN